MIDNFFGFRAEALILLFRAEALTQFKFEALGNWQLVISN